MNGYILSEMHLERKMPWTYIMPKSNHDSLWAEYLCGHPESFLCVC